MENKPTFPSPHRYDGFRIHSNGKSGYEDIYIGKKKIKFHIYVWVKFHGDIPKSHMIHHVNEIKNDNRLENLEIITYQDHNRLHAGWVRENGVWVRKQCNLCKEVLPLENFYVCKSGKYSGRCIPCAIIGAVEWGKSNPEKRRQQHIDWKAKNKESHAEYMIEYRKKYKEKNGELIKQRQRERYRRVRNVKKPRT